MQATKVGQRRHLATRLIARLSGSARLLAMSWPQSELDNDRGVLIFLRKLAASPLVRRSLPNAAATMSQYFGFRKRQNETISEFLVRETLSYEEFQEALIRLREERSGTDPSLQDFGLEAIFRRQEEEDAQWNRWRNWRDSHDAGAEPAAEASADADATETGERPDAATDGCQRVPLVSEPDLSPQSNVAPEHGMNSADSFVLDVLRGWRLLQAATLSRDEFRDVLSATNNKLDFDSISGALQVLWDDQLIQHPRHAPSQFNAHWLEGDHDSSFWSWDDYNDDGWYEANWMWDDDWSSWNGPSDSPPSGNYDDAHETPDLNASELEDPQIKEAYQSERMAEALASEASLTWKKAQEATAALRRDRGFGAVKGKSSTSSTGCFNCGSPLHLARDCPDRGAPKGKSKGFNKGKMGMAVYGDPYMEQFPMVKGKGKGKAKYSNYMDHEMFWAGKSKGKSSKGSSSFSFRPPGPSGVNAYGMELYPIEFMETPEYHESLLGLHRLRHPRPSSPEGMVDSGATASAGPEASIHRVFECLRQVDPEATLTVEQTLKPRFRYGSGKWGQALCQVTISSWASGHQRKFSVFALPNPPEYHEPWYDDSLSVPILISMDFLGVNGVGLVLGFVDGYSWMSNVPDANPNCLRISSKGHFVLDLVSFLTNKPHGFTSDSTWTPSRAISDANVLELYMTQGEELFSTQHGLLDNTDARRCFFQQCVHRRSAGSKQKESTAGDRNLWSDASEDQPCRQGSRVGSQPSSSSRSERPQMWRMLAMFRESQRLRERIKQVWSMDPLRRVQPTDAVCSKDGLADSQCRAHRSSLCGEGSQHGSERSQGCEAPLQTHEGGCGEDRERRALLPDGAECSRDDPSSEISHTPPVVHTSEEINAQFRGGADPRSPAAHVEPKLATCDSTKGPSQVTHGVSDECGISSSGDTSGSPEPALSRGADCLGAACCRSDAEPIRGSTVIENVPIKVGKAAVKVLQLMMLGLFTNFHDLVVEPHQVDVWEICCSPQSWLSEACTQEGLKCQRINLANGFDLNRPHTFESMTELYKIQRPKRLWISMRCTLWCAWTSLNYNTPERVELLESKRRKERKVLRNLKRWLERNVIDDHTVHVFWEWPANCQGWYEQVLLDLQDALWRLDRDWLPCRIDGCRYGLTSGRPGHEHEPLLKRWLVKTTCARFHALYKAKTCAGNHQHLQIESSDTARSSYYPWKMVVAIAKTWKSQLVPERWQSILFLTVDSNVPNSTFEQQLWEMNPAEIADDIAEVPPDEGYSPTSLAPEDAPAIPADLADDDGQMVLPPAQDERSGGDLRPQSMQSSKASNPSQMASSRWQQDGHGRWSKHEADGKIIPSTKQLAEWNVKLQKFHKASGHPSNRNLARILREAGKEKWQIEAALRLRCPACEATRPGGSSSGKIPPVSTNRLPQAWHMVMMDVGEWNVVSVRKKLKFLLMIDAATKFRSTVPLMVYDINQQGNENAKMVIEAFGRGWLAEKPKPLVVVPDNANTLCSAAFREFCHTNNLWLSPPVEKEAWAHGIAERAVQETKLLADKIFISDGTLSLELCLALSTAALNSTENAHGFSPFQWAYGHSFHWTDEDITTHLQLQQAHPLSEFEKLLSCRREAENLARQVRANNILVRLKNSCPRQPLQNFEPATLVKVWRKSLPHEAAKGKRSGFTKTIKPHWVGPGRVLFQELLPSQSGGDRRHVVWVVLGGRAHRCSVHSVRPLTSQEEALHEIQHGGEEMSWKSITDFLTRRDYVDMLDDEPGADDVEAPDLPAQPDKSTWLPSCRLYGKTDKQGNDKAAQALKGAAMRLPALPPVNEYEETDFLPEVPDDTFEDDLGNSLNDPGVKRKTDLLESEVSSREASSKRSSLASSSMRPMRPHSAVDSDDIVTGDSVKKPRTDDDNALTLDLHAALQEAEFGYIMEMELDFSSHRKLKKFLQAPNFYLVQQMRDCEVRYERLTDDFKKLFDRAKDKEVASFLKSEAVRKCISKEEEEEGKNSGRAMKCRWVLTWKDTPPDERQASQQDAHENPGTLFTPSGDRKAKARIVLLGYQHPDLLNPEFRSSAPVQSTLTRHLTFQLSVQNQWPIEGMDLSTAFLQTEKNQEQNRIWTSGVRELRAALGVSEGGIMRILKDFYGSTTAPRGPWLDIGRRLRRLGAHKVLGDPCAWIWVEENPNAVNQLDRFRTIGYMAGHVDDFNRSGDETNPKWQKIKAAIDREYQWGSSKVGAYRYVGSDIHHRTGSQGNYSMVDQDSYVENLADVEIDPVRFKNAATVLTKSEIGKCRSALGALQWLAVQTQPQICARCNLLLSELAREPKMTVAQEIQQVIRETRKHPHRLRFDRIPSVNHWQQMVVVTMGDQAHNNRPDGSSTGGLINFLGGPELLDGSPGRLVMVSWRTWKLRRVAISSNDAEIQAMVEAEDVNFRTRLLWAELNGAGAEKGLDLLAFAEQEVSAVPGVVATDSKGGFDAVTLQEGPYLGLSNVRSAIQAFQLKQSFADTKAWLIWLASDWLLADALTKKIQECRKSLLQFMRTGVWMLQYNPGFETSARKNKRAGKDALTQMKKATEKFAS